MDYKKNYAKFFIGATVNILPDNDKPGETLAEEISRDLKQYADMTVSLMPPDREILKERLVNRKAASGFSPEEAEAHVMFSDLYNADLCMEHALPADLVIQP